LGISREFMIRFEIVLVTFDPVDGDRSAAFLEKMEYESQYIGVVRLISG
jgi:hypothetical protein